MGEKFYIRFTEQGHQDTHYIDEPFGYDSAIFSLKQEEKRLSRDAYFSEGEIDFEFRHTRNHKLDRILYLFDKYGFEAEAMLGIELQGELIELEIGFSKAETDGITYFKCQLIQESKLQILKRRKDVKVNLLSKVDLDGGDINPCVPKDILLRAKPLVQVSKWRASNSTFNESFYGNSTWLFPIFLRLDQYDLETSLTPFAEKYYLPSNSNQSDFTRVRDEITLVKAKFKLIDITVRIKGLNLALSITNSTVNTRLNLNYGTSQVTGQFTSVTLFSSSSLNINLLNKDYEVVIPSLEAGSKIWLNLTLDHPGVPSIVPTSSFGMDYSARELEIQASSQAFSTVAPSIRLYDALQYVVKSICGADILAPSFGATSDLWNQRLINGNYLRQKKDEPFYLSLQQIEDSINEFKADYEIQPDGKVFFGLYSEFYRNEEIAFFDSRQFDSFNKTMNPRYSINQFSFGYKEYQSKKEATIKNTIDSVHGESEWLLPARKVENKHEVKVEWIRDSFSIAQAQRKAFEVSKTTATQDDDKIYIIDTYTGMDTYLTLKESAFVQFQYNPNTSFLTVRNDSTFSWRYIGIVAGQSFNILIGNNVGNYTVISVTDQSIVLSGGGSQNFFNGESVMTFNYQILSAGLVGVNWTDQGIITSNIANGDNFANLRFSIKQNIKKYFNQFLATANLYNKTLAIKNTFYKNNPDAFISVFSVSTTEGESFVPDNPILSPVMYKDCIFIAEMYKFAELMTAVRTKRGFVRFIDNEGFVRKMYAKNVSYERLGERLNITEGEEKNEPAIINVVTNANGTITINNEYTVNGLLWESQEDRIRLTDNEGYLMYNPIFWNRMAINGNLATSQNQLLEWLQIL